MGKETKFHPISLPSIRGAFRQCGFKVGKLRQINLSVNRRRAWYTVEIAGWPNDLDPDTLPFKTLIGGLRSCFSYDIKVMSLQRNTSGQWWAQLDCNLDATMPIDEPLFPALVEDEKGVHDARK